MGVPAGRHPARRSVGFCCPGLRPGTRRGDGHNRSNSRSGGGDVGPGGAVWACRTRRKPVHGGSMAPCSCALSCAHGKTGVGLPAQPARGVPRAHGANGPASPHRPTSDRSRRIFAFGRCRPWSTHIHATRGCERSDPLLTLTFLFFFDFPWRTHTETVRGRAGGLRRGVSRMDAATELTGTYLQRPLRSPPARPNQGF